MDEWEKRGERMASAMLAHIDKSLKPILARLDGLEQQIKSLPKPKDGKDADPETVAKIVKGQVQSELATIWATIEAWSAPEPDREVMRGMVETAVSEAISAIPVPKDGKDGRDGIDGKDGLPGERGEKGECGVGVAGAFIERDGSLAVTLSNGEVKNLGPVCGKDGAPGQDGKDGIGFDDLDLVEDASGLSLKFVKGDTVKSFPLPVVIDRGVFRDGQTYQKGSGVTWGGRYWIAQETTSDKPDGGKSWRLAVNKGRDGKDAKKVGE